jgi:hypothetical protein
MFKPSNEQMKQELIEQHREINVNYDDWADSTYEWFEEYLAERGIDWVYRDGKTREMSWSGFWSQGDGFSFSGTIHGRGIKKYIGDKYPMLNRYAEAGYWFEASWQTSHHRNTTTPVNIESEYFSQLSDDPMTEIWDIELAKELENLETDLEEDVESLCRMMYRKLEKEYDYLTSDEQVWESIVANDLNSITNDEGELAWV